MKILIEFKVEPSQLEDFLTYINECDFEEQWTVKKCPKRYKKIVEDWV
jgi:hypothetical protein